MSGRNLDEGEPRTSDDLQDIRDEAAREEDEKREAIGKLISALYLQGVLGPNNL
jgi:hypothetical protein